MDRVILHAWLWTATMLAVWGELLIGRFGLEAPLAAAVIFSGSVLWGGRRMVLPAAVAGAVLDAVLGRVFCADIIGLCLVALAGNAWRRSLDVHLTAGIALLGLFAGTGYTVFVAALEAARGGGGNIAALLAAVAPAAVFSTVLFPIVHRGLATGAKRLEIRMSDEDDDRRRIPRGSP